MLPILISHKDKVDVITPTNILFIRVGGLDKDDVMTPVNILFIGWGILTPHEDKQTFIYYPNQHIAHRGWQIWIPDGDKVDVITPINILFRGCGEF